MVGAFTSVGGLAFTVYKGTQEWKKWKRERHVLKRAEVAAEVLVTTLRFLSGLQQIASPWITGEGRDDQSPPPTSERDRRQRDIEALAKILAQRWESFAPTSNAFVAAWEHAEVFLPAGVMDFLEKIWKARASIKSNQHTHIVQARQGGDNPKFFEGGLGDEVELKLLDLRKEAKEILRPLAQMMIE